MKKDDSLCSTDYVKHDSAHVLAHGLFRSLKKGERKNSKLDITHEIRGGSILFVGFEPLGADDLRILQGIIALSGPEGIQLLPEPKTEMGKSLRSMLIIKDDDNDAVNQDAIMIRDRISRLLSEIGLTDGGENIKALKDSLLRMSNFTVIACKNKVQASFHLLSYSIDLNTGEVCIALNPLLARAIMGGQHVRISMSEVRALRSEPARIIHQRLCGWINPGKMGRISLDTICSYAWPDDATDDALRKRRQLARKALDELVSIGWTVREYVRGKLEIKRPSIR